MDTSAKNFNPLFQFIAEGDRVSFKAESTGGKGLSTANVSLSTFKDNALTAKK